VRLVAAPLILIGARARRRPARWLLTALGVSIAVAFAGAVAAEGTIAGDEGARATLAGLAPLDRAVRVTWQGPLTPAVERQARALLARLGLGPTTQVLLLNPVRLSGIVVRPAAIDPLGTWLGGSSSPRPLGPCRPSSCPVLVAGGRVGPGTLRAAGVHLTPAGTATALSAAPLGFSPDSTGSQPPLVITDDVAGLDRIAGLSGVYRTHSWLALLPTSQLQSWQLAGLEGRLRQAQSALVDGGGQLSVTGPFAGLDAARRQASAAPRRLLLAGGGALTVLAGFIVLAAGGLRGDQATEVARLKAAGARSSQVLVFVVGEAAWICAAALLAGACLAVGVAALLARRAGLPVAGVLGHSLLTPVGAAAIAGGWACATGLVGAVLLARGRHLADVLAVAAAASLALALSRGSDGSGPLPVLLAPLSSLAAGVLIFRGTSAVLRAGERLARRGPAMIRLAFITLARVPAGPSLAVAFVAISTGLGGFGLAYRATLLRGTADQAAERVPLDATISPAADFTTPLALATLARWGSLAGGRVLPVRRTYATFAGGAGSVTVPALGVSAAALALMHGWRESDGSAPLATLARRLTPPGPARVAGPTLAPASRSLALHVSAAAIGVEVTADLRDRSGAVRRLRLGAAGRRPRIVRGRLPPGSWELEALELDEPAGLAATNGHQNGENPAAETQFDAPLTVGPLTVLGRSGHLLAGVPLGSWRGVGAVSADGRGARGAAIRFAATGEPGVLRPAQPSDSHPLAVLVDPQTARAASAGRIALTVDGLPVAARVVGVLARFPTLAPDAPGFVVADETALAAALDAQLPGQGRADELWISTAAPARLAAELRTGPLSVLRASFRGALERGLRSAPIASGVLGTLLGATAVSGALALLGLLAAVSGPGRDRSVERDLAGLGVGPRGRRRELVARLLICGVLGVWVGLAVGVLLTRLAVGAVRAAGAAAMPRPALVTVVPWAELALGGLVAVAALAAASFVAAGSPGRHRRSR